MITRYLQKQVAQDLKKKMVFISGSKQVGKTTLADFRSLFFQAPLLRQKDGPQSIALCWSIRKALP